MGTKKQTDDSETISVIEAKRRLGIGINQTYQAIRRGEIQAIRLGGRWRVLTAPLNKMVGKTEAA